MTKSHSSTQKASKRIMLSSRFFERKEPIDFTLRPCDCCGQRVVAMSDPACGGSTSRSLTCSAGKRTPPAARLVQGLVKV
jgi:hypothetical protein